MLEHGRGRGRRRPCRSAAPAARWSARPDFDRTICYDDLATGGSIMVFGPDRDLLEVVDSFMEFFVEESCGYCTPCRVGNVLLKERLEKILARQGRARRPRLPAGAGRDDEDHEPLRPGPDLAQPGAHHAGELPPSSTRSGSRRPRRPSSRRSTSEAAVAEAEALAGRKSVIYAGK